MAEAGRLRLLLGLIHHRETYDLLLVRALLACVTLTICTRLTAQATFHEHVHIRVHVPEITDEIHHREETIVKEIPIIRHRKRPRLRPHAFPRPPPHPRHRHLYRQRESVVPATATAMAAAHHLYHGGDVIDDDDDDAAAAIDDIEDNNVGVVDLDDHYADSTNAHTAYAYARYNELDNDHDYASGSGVGVVANYPPSNVHSHLQNVDSLHRNSYLIDDDENEDHDNDDDDDDDDDHYNNHSPLFHERVVRTAQPAPHASPLFAAAAAPSKDADQSYRYVQTWPPATVSDGVGTLSTLRAAPPAAAPPPPPAAAAAAATVAATMRVKDSYEMEKNYAKASASASASASALTSSHPSAPGPHSHTRGVGNNLRQADVARYFRTTPLPPSVLVTMPNGVVLGADSTDEQLTLAAAFAARQLRPDKKMKNYSQLVEYSVVADKFHRRDGNITNANANGYQVIATRSGPWTTKL